MPTPPTSFLTTFCLRAIIFEKSKVTSFASTPYLLLPSALSYSFALYSRVLVGIHSSLRQTPPNSLFSIKTTLSHFCPALSAATYPAGPPPIIAKSNVVLIVESPILLKFKFKVFDFYGDLFQETGCFTSIQCLMIVGKTKPNKRNESVNSCLLYTSDAADEEDSVDLGGRRIIK